MFLCAGKLFFQRLYNNIIIIKVRAFNNYTASNYSDKTIVGRKGANCVEPSPSLETRLYSTIEFLSSSPSTSFLVIGLYYKCYPAIDF